MNAIFQKNKQQLIECIYTKEIMKNIQEKNILKVET